VTFVSRYMIPGIRCAQVINSKDYFFLGCSTEMLKEIYSRNATWSTFIWFLGLCFIFPGNSKWVGNLNWHTQI